VGKEQKKLLDLAATSEVPSQEGHLPYGSPPRAQSLFFLFLKKTQTESGSNFFFLIRFHNLNHMHIIFLSHIGKILFVVGEKKSLKIQPSQRSPREVVNKYKCMMKRAALRAIP